MSRPESPPAPSPHPARKREKWRPDNVPLPSAESDKPLPSDEAEGGAPEPVALQLVGAGYGETAESPTAQPEVPETEIFEPEIASSEVAGPEIAGPDSGELERGEAEHTDGTVPVARASEQRVQKTSVGGGQKKRLGLSPRQWREQRAEAEQRELWQALRRGRATVPDTPAERAKAQAEARALLRPTPVRWVWVMLPLLLLAAAASRVALPIREVAVSGNTHLSAEQVVQAAGVHSDTGWLYYGARQARGLSGEPWVAAATVTRQFPDRLHIAVTERTPYALWRRTQARGGDVLVARDGTLLTSSQTPKGTEGSEGTESIEGVAADSLPTVEGWGPSRLPEALALLETLRPYHVQLVKFTPSGFTVYTAEGGAAWSGDLATLLKHSDALSQYPNKPLYIYPWGVSVQE